MQNVIDRGFHMRGEYVMAEIISAAEAVSKIKDNDFIGMATFGLAGTCIDITLALRDSFRKTGHPRDLSLVHGGGFGNFRTLEDGHIGGDWLSDKGLLKRMIAGHNGDMPEIMRQIAENELAGWYFPQGTLLQTVSESGRGMKGALSKVGLGTFMDPRIDGGALNQLAKDMGDEWVKYIPDLDGEEYLWYRAFPLNVAVIRGTYADEAGNISIEKEAMFLEVAEMARAAKANGGIVIVQVENIVRTGDIAPKMVAVPAYLVDYIVICEHQEYLYQTHQTHYNPAFSGEIRLPAKHSSKKLPLNAEKVICRRAAMEIRKGYKCNFGLGMVQAIGNIIAEEGLSDDVVMISESGSIGGIAQPGLDFGAHLNIEASINQKLHFDWFDCGLLDFGAFGLSEVDRHGDINVSLLNGKLGGVGGFTNITRSAKCSVFAGSFTAVGLKTHIEDGKLIIDQEGKFKKFVNHSPQVAFSADESLKAGHTIMYITERCVFIRDERGVVLSEIADGIDIQKDILDQMEFTPVIPKEGVKLMPPEIFRETWGELDKAFYS